MGHCGGTAHVAGAFRVHVHWTDWKRARRVVLCYGDFLGVQISLGVEQEKVVLAFDCCGFTHSPSSDLVLSLDRCVGSLILDFSVRSRRCFSGSGLVSSHGDIHGA